MRTARRMGALSWFFSSAMRSGFAIAAYFMCTTAVGSLSKSWMRTNFGVAYIGMVMDMSVRVAESSSAD